MTAHSLNLDKDDGWQAVIDAAVAVAPYVATPRGREMNPTERAFVDAVAALIPKENDRG